MDNSEDLPNDANTEVTAAPLEFIVTINPDGSMIDFGLIPIVADMHYTKDTPDSFDASYGPVYENSTTELQEDTSVLHTGGTWIRTKTPAPPVVTAPNPIYIPATQADIIEVKKLIADLAIKVDALTKAPS